MAKIIIHQEKTDNAAELVKLCPFGAIQFENGQLNINAACKMCKLCVRKGPEGVFEFVEDQVIEIDKDAWQGIAVYVEHTAGQIHPVTFELIGKARELAAKIDHPVYVVFIGHEISHNLDALRCSGVDSIYVYDHPELKDFRVEPYTAAFEDFIQQVKPSTVLIGGTTIGRSLAPRVAARFRTGLTADCTLLDMQPNTDLDQIRPAFGGNIMAHIRTQNSRPQFATVRYKIFSAPEPVEGALARVVPMQITQDNLVSGVTVLSTQAKQAVENIEDAEVIIVAGRAIKKESDLDMLQALADRLGGQVAATRPLVEAGWIDARRQIGLSGRTVSPKLMIVCGVSGAVQFTAGMSGAEHVVAINTDPNAPIFKVAHVGLVGDLYEIIPRLIEQIDAGQNDAVGCRPVGQEIEVS
jgi:electron transfer flavoprotein alpha subunit